MMTKSSKPKWLKKRITKIDKIQETVKLLDDLSLNTVCLSAECPNIGECYGNGTATFMILGDVCTRGCNFCAVNKGKPQQVDFTEPMRIANVARALGLKHVVVTSVTRDDLTDGGASHFAETVRCLKACNPNITIEILIPDLKGDWKALETMIAAKPDILNHNLETVPSLYSQVRPEAQYHRSLNLLKKVKEIDSEMITKSGLMVGLGETDEEMDQVMEDLSDVGCDLLTIGQYLQPSEEHIEMQEYIHPIKFKALKELAELKGFKHVAAGPFVRSSYKAHEGIIKIREKSIH